MQLQSCVSAYLSPLACLTAAERMGTSSGSPRPLPAVAGFWPVQAHRFLQGRVSALSFNQTLFQSISSERGRSLQIRSVSIRPLLLTHDSELHFLISACCPQKQRFSRIVLMFTIHQCTSTHNRGLFGNSVAGTYVQFLCWRIEVPDMKFAVQLCLHSQLLMPSHMNQLPAGD
jgi:hypothetical protein